MKLPINDGSFVTDLILQRTRPFIARGGKPALTEWSRTGSRHQLLTFLQERGQVAEYVSDAVSEIESDVREYCDLAAVPAMGCGSFVSIGCGNGIAELFFWRRLVFNRLLLIDTEAGGHSHGFGKTGAGYSNLKRTEAFLRDNGVKCGITLWNPRTDPAPSFRFDLMVSMYAMGFHFPAKEYDGWIAENALPRAVCAYDVRGPDGFVSRVVSRRAM